MKTFAKFEAHPVVKEVDGKFIGNILLFQNGVLIEHKITPVFDSEKEATSEVQQYQFAELIKAEIQNQKDMH